MPACPREERRRWRQRSYGGTGARLHATKPTVGLPPPLSRKAAGGWRSAPLAAYPPGGEGLREAMSTHREDEAMTVIRRQLGSPAMIVACVALIVALGGVSYAAGVLPKNSVGTAQLKKKAVTASKLRKNAVSAAKVKDGTLLAADFRAGQL